MSLWPRGPALPAIPSLESFKAPAVSAVRAAAALAVLMACVTGLHVGAPVTAAEPIALDGADTTFVYQAALDRGVRGAQGSRAREHVDRPRRRLAAKKKQLLDAPAGFDVGKTFYASYRRGQAGTEALIHIDLPVRAGTDDAVAKKEATRLPASLRLSKMESSALIEEQDDPGALDRLKAQGAPFAQRVDAVMSAIKQKQRGAALWRANHPRVHSLSQMQAVTVTKADTTKWQRQMQAVDDAIAAHGGVPVARGGRMRRALRHQTQQQELVYQASLRRAFGAHPTLPVA